MKSILIVAFFFILSLFLANSIKAICIPKQIPRKGILFSLAYFIAEIFPSVPLFPKPPGINNPEIFFNLYDQIDIVVDPDEHVYPMLVAPNGSLKDMWIDKDKKV